jgi:hypothetical protein
MMDLGLWGRGRLPGSAAEALARLDANPGIRDELRNLLAYRLGRIDSVAPRLQLPFPCPLSLHAPYTRDEVLAALGHWTASGSGRCARACSICRRSGPMPSS